MISEQGLKKPSWMVDGSSVGATDGATVDGASVGAAVYGASV